MEQFLSPIDDNFFRFKFAVQDKISCIVYEANSSRDDCFRLHFDLDLPISWTINEGCTANELRKYLIISMLKKVKDGQMWENIVNERGWFIKTVYIEGKNVYNNKGCHGVFLISRAPHEQVEVCLKYRPFVVTDMEIKILSNN